MTDSGIPLSAASFALGELWFMLGLLPADVHTSLCSLWIHVCHVFIIDDTCFHKMKAD